MTYTAAIFTYTAANFTKNLLNGKNDFQRLINTNPTTAQKLLDQLSDLIKKIKTALSGKGSNHQSVSQTGLTLSQLQEAERLWTEAFRAVSQNTSANDISNIEKDNVQFSFIKMTKDGIPEYRTDFSESLTPVQRQLIFKDRIATVFNLGAVTKKTDVKKIQVFGDKYTIQKNVFGDLYATTAEKAAKINALYDITDILERATYIGKSVEGSYGTDIPPKNEAHKDVKYWYKFAQTINLDGIVYDVTFSIRDKGKDQFAYLIDFNRKQDSNVSHTTKNSLRRAHSNPVDIKIPQKDTGVNTYSMQNEEKDSTKQPEDLGESKFSFKDSVGKTLTPEQVEFFKDSKVRDENGDLLVVYHGTSEQFTVFDKTKGRSGMDIQGSFFSPWELDARGYGGIVGEYYLRITNPADEGTAYKALKRFQGQNYAGIKAREYLEGLGYDGVNNGNEEYIVFSPNQIKSIDNLNPTDDPDIRFSLKTPSAIENLFKAEAQFTIG